MNVIFKAIDKVEQALGHSPHPPITDVPVGAWTVSGISDVMGAVTGDTAYDDCARISMGIGLLGAAGAVVTGLRDYSYIPKDRQPNHAIATRHAVGNAVAGTLYAASYVLRTRDGQAGRRPSRLARLLGLAGGGLVVYTSWLGGRLVEELGEAVKPVMNGQSNPAGQPELSSRQPDGKAGRRGERQPALAAGPV
jgi:uncharacterized membrane protein